jgi:hypothetical protein
MVNKGDRKNMSETCSEIQGPEIQQIWKKPPRTVLKKKVNLQEVSEHSNGEIANFTWRWGEPSRMKTIQLCIYIYIMILILIF